MISMDKDLELFNQHQEDLRGRTDSLAKAMFVLAGGALTVSIGLFMSKERLPVSDYAISVLQVSWWLLFVSIMSGVLSLSIMILRDYFLGERWRRKNEGEPNMDVSGRPGVYDAFLFLFSFTAVLSFIGGFGCLAYVSTITVGNINW